MCSPQDNTKRTDIEPLEDVHGLRSILSLFLHSPKHQVDVLFKYRLLLSYGLLREAMCEQLANIPMVVSVSVKDKGLALQPGKVLFILEKRKLPSLLSVNLLPLGSIDV